MIPTREALRATYDAVIEEIDSGRGSPQLTNAFYSRVGDAIFDACYSAVEQSEATKAGVKIPKALKVVSAPMGAGPSCVPRAVSAAQLQLLPGDRGVPLRPLCPVWLRPNPVAPGCSTGAVHTRPKGTKLTALSPQRSEREPARAARNVMKRVGVFPRESCRFLRATVVLLQHFNNFERKPHCRADCLVCYLAHSGIGGLP